MFDFGIGYTELVVIAIAAIVVIGPKDLPRVLRSVGKTVAKMRGMAREFQGHVDAVMREAGLDEVKKEIQAIKSGVSLDEPKKGNSAEAKKAAEDFAKYFGPLETSSETTKTAA